MPRAGSLHGTLTWQTGVIGQRVTLPLRPLFSVPPPAAPQPSARAATAATANGLIPSPRADGCLHGAGVLALRSAPVPRAGGTGRSRRERRARRLLLSPKCRRH